MDNFRVVTWKEGFNYSAINNFGAGFAKGEYLLLLNNDIEMLSGGCLEDMLGFCMQEGVGIVGAKLFYGDDTVQHAGVVVGLGGVAGHAFVGLPREEYGYMAKAMCTQEMSAVTAACMLESISRFFTFTRCIIRDASCCAASTIRAASRSAVSRADKASSRRFCSSCFSTETCSFACRDASLSSRAKLSTACQFAGWFSRSTSRLLTA